MMNASRALVPSVIVEISHLNGFAYGINKVRIIIALYLAASRISVGVMLAIGLEASGLFLCLLQ